MQTRTIETSIHHKTIEDQVAAFLYASGIMHDNNEILKIHFGELKKDGTVPLEITFKEEKEVDVIVHNG
jgi:hypothetical protein